MTSSHIWTLQPSPPPFPGPKFIASSLVCCKCATSRLEITALECVSVNAADRIQGGSRISPGAGRQALPGPGTGFFVQRWKLLEILLRRPSVQTTCSGQCRCTVVCTLVRLGKGQQRHGRLGTKCADSKERTAGCSFVESHIQCFSSQVLQTRDQEALRDSARGKDCWREDQRVRPRGPLTWSVIWGTRQGSHHLCEHAGESGLHV